MPSAALDASPGPAERIAKMEYEWTEILKFYQGKYQELRRHFHIQFPTANWRHEEAAFLTWAALARVRPIGHEQVHWSLDECRRLYDTANGFLDYLDAVKAHKVTIPEWAKNLSAPTLGSGGRYEFGTRK